MLKHTTAMPYRAEALDFFQEHAGWIQRRGQTTEQAREESAREHAQAELWAATMGGLVFKWMNDPEGNVEGEHPAFGCIAVRHQDAGDVLAGLWGITFGPEDNAWYRRVIEAELAMEVLNEIKENDFLLAFSPELRALVAYAIS